MNKKRTLSIIIGSILLISVGATISTTVSAADPTSIRGYVYVDEEITTPDQVKVSFSTKEYYADLPGSPAGFYVIDVNEDIGETGSFFVTISGSTWLAKESVVIDGKIVIPINLSINTSEDPIDEPPAGDGDGDGDGGGSGGGGGSGTSGGDSDGDGDTDTNVTPNNPPVMISFTTALTGTGKQNTNYTFSANASDPDEGQQIRYIFNWDDGSDSTTDYMASNTTYNIENMWTYAGIYDISVYAEDDYPEEGNGTISATLTLQVLIDVHIVDNSDCGLDGYLIDVDSNGIYDTYHNNLDGMETSVDEEDGTYMFDTDENGEYDFSYNPTTGECEILGEEPEPPADTTKSEEDNTVLYIIALLIIIILIILFYLATRKKEKKSPEEKEKKESNSKTAKKK